MRLLLFFLLTSIVCFAQKTNFSVLVYTKNGQGYVHDNIPSAVAAIQQMGVQKHFKVVVSDNPQVFEEKNLSQYRLLIFTSTNNDVFDNDSQRLAFRHYIEAGGGFVGVHSVTGTERKWSWFKSMVGETFTWHAKFQSFSVINIDPTHPSMKGVSPQWTKDDECYFGAELYPGIHALMMHDVSTLDVSQIELINKYKGVFGNYFPAVWTHSFQGGHVWVTTLGHSKESYQDPTYLNHLWQGINYIAGKVKKINYSKATSRDRDDVLKF